MKVTIKISAVSYTWDGVGHNRLYVTNFDCRGKLEFILKYIQAFYVINTARN